MQDDVIAFENPQQPGESIPDYRDLVFDPVARSFRGYTVLTTLLYWLPAILIGTAINLTPNITLLPGLLTPLFIVMMAVLVGLYRWVDAGHRGWAVRAHDISARKGVWWRSVTTLPFARVQHVETTSGPIERWKGLSRLKLFTAGGSAADLTLIGLDADHAHRLREHLAEQIRLRDAESAQPPDGSDESV